MSAIDSVMNLLQIKGGAAFGFGHPQVNDLGSASSVSSLPRGAPTPLCLHGSGGFLHLASGKYRDRKQQRDGTK